MLLSPKKTIIYGPVNSRRLGRSLGVNILPAGQKTCTFNCVYCQYGWTDFRRMQDQEGFSWPSEKEVNKALEAALVRMAAPPAYITFSGNGEPSLHPFFPEIVAAVNRARDLFAPNAQTAILSNSTLASHRDIREGLANLDRRIMKFDCGDNETFLHYNQPLDDFEVEDLVCGLKNIDNIAIQALFSGGEAGNTTPANLDAWLEKIKDIRPSHVQIYTLDRDAPAEKLIPLSEVELKKIAILVNKAGIPADIFGRAVAKASW